MNPLRWPIQYERGYALRQIEFFTREGLPMVTLREGGWKVRFTAKEMDSITEWWKKIKHATKRKNKK